MFLVLVLYVIIAATDSIRVRITLINVMGICTISIVRIISSGWRV